MKCKFWSAEVQSQPSGRLEICSLWYIFERRIVWHRFIKYGAAVLFPKYVSYPTTATEYSHHQEEFTGLNGTIPEDICNPNGTCIPVPDVFPCAENTGFYFDCSATLRGCGSACRC